VWKPVGVNDGQESDLLFAGSIPELYERFLVPLIFQPYADDLAERLAEIGPATVLEVAAGTGVVTRTIMGRLPADVAITATDLNQPMLDYAASIGTRDSVTWKQADAMKLPFDDGAFDAVVCQFGAMFFPDRARAYAEFRRVLRRGGTLLFNVWDDIENNEVTKVVNDSVASAFPDDPPGFLARTPHGYHDTDLIRRDLVAAGFSASPSIDSPEARSRAASCTHPAIGFCQGSPLRNEIETRDPSRLEEVTTIAAAAVGDRFGTTDIDGKIRAHVITVVKS
jgi:SAM-dependent methyltransferase